MMKNKAHGLRLGSGRLGTAAGRIWRDKILYLMLLPTLVYFFIFRV